MSKAKFPACCIGNRYGKLVVQELISARNPLAYCRCDCGQYVTRQRGGLVRGITVSCGCSEPLQLIQEAIVVETDACIISPTCKNKSGGYGVLRLDGRVERAHRVAYAHANGLKLSDIAGLHILHKCDNPPCINPRHLVAGTHLDNMQDMFAKGRRIAAIGENASKAKLTEKDVRDIRMRIIDGESNPSIAKDYPVKAGAIRAIRAGKTWSHV